MDRVIDLLKMYSGYVLLAPETPILHGSWPGKNWSIEELGDDPRKAGYNWAIAYFNVFLLMSVADQARIILSWANEEMRGDKEVVATFDDWRDGVIDAHKEAAEKGCVVRLSTGARQFTNRVYKGESLSESIQDIRLHQLKYLNDTDGFVNIHIHDRPGSGYEDDPMSEGVIELRDMMDWLYAKGFTNLRAYVGEYSFRSIEDDKILTEEQLASDFEVMKAQWRLIQQWALFIVYYQIEDHSKPEGKFSDTSALRRASLFKQLRK